MSRIWLSEIKYTFSQEGNCNGTTDEEEILTITVESGSGSIAEFGGFLTFRTAGWSVDNKTEMDELLEFVEKGVGSELKFKI